MSTAPEPPHDPSLERLDPHEVQDYETAHHFARYDWAARFLPAARVLDCSCGVGYGSALLRERGAAAVVGVDISAEALDIARQRYARDGIEFVQSDARALDPARLGQFDLIVSLETLEHIERPTEVLDGFRTLLQPNGILALSVPNDRLLGEENPYHAWVADCDEVRGWLTERFAHVTTYGELRGWATGVWPRDAFVGRTGIGPAVGASARLVDAQPLTDAAGFLFACSLENPPPTVPPTTAHLLKGAAYVRELNEACRQLDESKRWFEEQAASWKDTHEEQTAAWTDARQQAQAHIEQLQEWIRQLEEGKSWLESQRKQELEQIGQQSEELSTLHTEIDRLQGELSAHEARWAALNQHFLVRCLRKLGALK
jgi:SAM-dependent methyltransferase